MAHKNNTNTNNRSQNLRNPIEALSDLGRSIPRQTANSFKNIGAGALDQLLGNDYFSSENNWNKPEQKPFSNKEKAPPQLRQEFTLFHEARYDQDQRVPKEIMQINTEIKQEIEAIKKQSAALLQEAKDAQNIVINQGSEGKGIYHIRFLELVLHLLRTLRLKIGESQTWMQAMSSKKKKRGSLFASLSKKKGTQYSMSQELSNARSVQ